MHSQPDQDQSQHRSNRRCRPTGPFDELFTPDQRRSYHRTGDSNNVKYQYFDKYGVAAGFCAVMLLILTIVDGTITMLLLDMHCEEANPFMARLIEYGLLPFILGKYALTAAGLPVLLVFKEHRMFGTGFRVGYLLPIFVGMYLVLLGYQVQLLNTPIPSLGPLPTNSSVVAQF